MASRTAYVATESVGDVLTKANFDKLPGGLIGYTIDQSGQTGINTTTDLTALAVTVTVNTSRIVKVEGYLGYCDATAVTVVWTLGLNESSTVLATSVNTSVAGSQGQAAYVCAILSPSSGSHTYKLTGNTGAASGRYVASSTSPAYICVTDLGPSF